MPNQSETTHPLKMFALNSNKPLAEKIAAAAGVELGKATIKHFSDGEISITVDESIRGDDIFLIQSVSDPVNTNLMELMIMVDAVRRASAYSITVVIPYYGYSRADRKARSREPITAKLIASLLEDDGVDRVVTLDLHAAQLQGFFDIPMDHLEATPLLAGYFIDHGLTDNLVVVSPDHAGVSKARRMADLLQAPLAIIDNRDPDKSTTSAEAVIGSVKGKNAILVDDIIDTAVRISISAQTLKNAGANDIYAVATHPVFSKNAVTQMKNSPLKKVVVTDSIQMPEAKMFDKLEIISVGDLMGQAIRRIYSEQSVGQLFIN
ncbi:ribose-phosphate pyrophosphokinase [Secundilactobacillus pentosiphilus]|uniref:Putative ribose-phosphate pyrophosphokinase n=1 Tax=Secundilactobacillus pentosiphilus TaxID=1714682 RepID=A0A1Z5IPA5_9LACO|nr:ribose-phosphate diphosphokinase [Secundilactobacillus pentosiphilus]GAX03587.1 ribose-phosphate pyrophosphokinase [Secundilactobacillus pentosiphilus]GAX05576.1 ribose-phosphate pyrophosphokinase [Secundilactobacillus pentosiphilus]